MDLSAFLPQAGVDPARMGENDVIAFLRLDHDEVQHETLRQICQAALRHIMDYTGLTAEELSSHPDLAVAFLVLVQDMYDNRSLYPDAKYANTGNKIVESILAMHRRNLL